VGIGLGRGFAEKLMSDLSLLDQVPTEKEDTRSSGDSVSLTLALRSGAAIAGSFGLVCGIGSVISGVPLMHPLLSLLIIVGSIGFYAMSYAPR
jgi:hypothetical protein